MKVRFFIVFILIFSSFSVNAEQRLFSFDLDTITYNCSDLPSGVDCLKGGWYLDYIGMPYIYEKGVDLSPDFWVAILDTGIGPYHENIDETLITDISDNYNNQSLPHSGEITSHGNLIAGIFSASKDYGNNGTRSIVKAKTLFMSMYSDESSDYTDYLLYKELNKILQNPNRPKIITSSVGYEAIERTNDSILSMKRLQNTRKLIQENSDVLFVFLAHNNSNDAKFGMGGLHYEFAGDFDTASIEERSNINNYYINKLDNLIIVASNDNKGILFEISNYGRSVDIAAPSNFFGVGAYTNTGESKYFQYIDSNTKNCYGYENIEPDSSFFDDIWNWLFPTMYASNEDLILEAKNYNQVANGTSSATPIVAGAAAILFSIDENLSPATVKEFLTKASGLIETKRRYNGSFNETDSLIYGIPLLNIETSMKWYEELYQEEIMRNLVSEFTDKVNWFYEARNYTSSVRINSDRTLAKYIYGDYAIYTHYPSFYPYRVREDINEIEHSYFDDFGSKYLIYEAISSYIFEYTNKNNGEKLYYNSITGEIKHLSSYGNIISSSIVGE